MKPSIYILAALFVLISYAYAFINYEINTRLIKKTKQQDNEENEIADIKGSLLDFAGKEISIKKAAFLLKTCIRIIYIFLGIAICLLILAARDF